MNKLLKIASWGLTFSLISSLVFIVSCSEDDPPVAPEISYAATTVAVGATGSVMPAVQGDPASNFAFKTPNNVPDFVQINSTTGEISISDESTTGEYAVDVVASNEGGSDEATVEITISINPSGFDPTSKTLIWKYWMNNTANVVMENLNTLPGQGGLPPQIPIPQGWPGGTPFQINPAVPDLEAYLVFPTVQYFLLQVPGDGACGALNPAEKGDTLALIVNSDLTLSTACKNQDNTPGTTVELGTSTVSYSGGEYTWSLFLTLQGVPVQYDIMEVTITNFTDPLDPHWTQPDGTPRTFSAVVGNVAQYTTPTDFADYLGSIALLDVDVVLEVLQ